MERDDVIHRPQWIQSRINSAFLSSILSKLGILGEQVGGELHSSLHVALNFHLSLHESGLGLQGTIEQRYYVIIQQGEGSIGGALLTLLDCSTTILEVDGPHCGSLAECQASYPLAGATSKWQTCPTFLTRSAPWVLIMGENLSNRPSALRDICGGQILQLIGYFEGDVICTTIGDLFGFVCFYFMLEAITIDQLPAADFERTRTDNVCTYISTLFTALLFGLACFRLNPSNLYRMAYPTDIEGRACGLDFPQFPYVYRTSLTDPGKRLCVNRCPKQGETMLSCVPSKFLSCKQNPSPEFEVVIYDSQLEATRAGLFCVPTDPIIRNQLSKVAGPIDNRIKYYSILDAMKIVVIVAFVLGIFFFFAIQCFPIRMPRVMIGLGLVGLVLIVIFTLLASTDIFRIPPVLKYVFVGILLILACMLLYTLLTKPLEIRLCTILLKYATMVVMQNCTIVMYILLFTIATVGAFALAIFQIFSFWSGGDLIRDELSAFYRAQSKFAIVMSLVVLFQLLWALFFLKEAFNLLLSGYGINWYFFAGGAPRAISPLKNLLCFHWGSVVGGSFLVMIFWLPSLILDYLVPSRNETITSTSCTSKILFQSCYSIQGLFDLCRTQAFAYINLTGLPYCNSCRYVEFLSQNTGIYTGSKSINRIFLLGLHAFILSICIVVGMIFLYFKLHATSLYMVLAVAMISYFLTTYFVSIHAYIADGILVTLLTEEYLSGGFQMVVRAPLDLKQEAFVLMNRPVQVVN